jgi:hypothetical protein
MASPASPARGDNRGGAAAPLLPVYLGQPEARAVRDSPVLFVTPFLVQASCELSEDCFLTRKVLVNTDDVVRPFARADGAAEARSLLKELAEASYTSHLSSS